MLYLPDVWILLTESRLTGENNTNGCLSSPASSSLAMGHMKLVFPSSHVHLLFSSARLPSPTSSDLITGTRKY